MKFFFTAILSIISISGFTQNTTQEEYLYLVKGYKTTIESGLDIKKGYSISDTVSFTTQGNKYGFTFMNLIRQNNKSLAGTIILAYSSISDKHYFLGMEAASEGNQIDLENTLMKQITDYGWDTQIKNAFIQALAEYLAIKLTDKKSVRIAITGR
ncbi:hypothetical protein [Flavihumibacter profundi]|jgi:hypothetical protein|uniref:hypothetical protein n=1 Tax=Flavihumibacter profundi TaxID=2716883 RepID=UPI001CC5917A|nr:hypothetical protein [Flavihumibacter profundi]MBZ5858373.1 hypothetical protein [Flavihumibacter profundi]